MEILSPFSLLSTESIFRFIKSFNQYVKHSFGFNKNPNNNNLDHRTCFNVDNPPHEGPILIFTGIGTVNFMAFSISVLMIFATSITSFEATCRNMKYDVKT